MARAFERLLRLQRGDLPRGLLLFAYLFLVIAAYLVGQVARDALFLGRFKASLLPFADLTLFLFVTAAVAVYVRAGRRLGLDRLLVGSLTLFGVGALALAVLARGSSRPWLFPVVYVWVGIFGVLAPAQVWTLANYVLTPREARRLFGFVGAGATLGATVGGVLSSAVARLFGAESLLVLVSALLLLATLPVRALWKRRPASVGGSAHAPRSRDGRAGQPPAGAGLAPPAGDRRDRGAVLVRDRGRGLAVQGHGAAGARRRRTPSPPSSARSTPGWAPCAWRRRCS